MYDNYAEPIKKRRWLRYTLRSFFAVLTMGCLLLGYWVHLAERQKASVKWVEENEGDVYYDFELDEDYLQLDGAMPPGPSWLHAFLGEDYLDAVIYVQLSDAETTDLTPLARLSGLEYLDLSYAWVRDLTPLGELSNLEVLRLYCANDVADLTPLAGLTNLKVLTLDHTQIQDLSPLFDLKHLEHVSLECTPIAQEQVEELQASLPNCHIRWSSTLNILPLSPAPEGGDPFALPLGEAGQDDEEDSGTRG